MYEFGRRRFASISHSESHFRFFFVTGYLAQ